MRMTPVWKFEDIHWSLFDPSQVDPAIMKIIKAGSVVERNGFDYGKYLKNVFKGDQEFTQAIASWELDEVKHGEVLAAWVHLADPHYDFDKAFAKFSAGYKIPVDVNESVRGSRASELLARCFVEIGTSSFYSAVKDKATEPLLKEICGRIAADELRHYKLFYTHFKRYQKDENLSLWERLKIMFGGLFETRDEELSYAYYAANNEPGEFDHKKYLKAYTQKVYGFYGRPHIDQAMALLCKAVGLPPQGLIKTFFSKLVYTVLKIARPKEKNN